MFSKKKLSIDFTQHSYNLLTDFARKKKKANSTVINDLCEVFLPLSDEILQKIGEFCADNLSEAIEAQQTKSGFEALEASRNLSQWMALAKYFPYYIDCDENSNRKMKKYQLKEGYCIVPQDYIVLGNIFGSPKECLYAGVVESKNSKTYGIPHFLFFCNQKYSDEYTDEMEEAIFDECRKVFPDFDKFYSMQKTLTAEEKNDREKLKEWDALPYFALFHIVEEGDPLYWNPVTPDFIPPDGAMIVRPKQEN